MGQINFEDLKKVPELCEGLTKPIEKCSGDIVCEPSVIAKKTRKRINTKRRKATRSLQIIHTGATLYFSILRVSYGSSLSVRANPKTLLGSYE